MTFQLLLNSNGSYHFDDFTIVSEALDTAYMAPDNVASRINRARKGNFTLKFVDTRGVPLAANVLQAGLAVGRPLHGYCAMHMCMARGRRHMQCKSLHSWRSWFGGGGVRGRAAQSSCHIGGGRLEAVTLITSLC